MFHREGTPTIIVTVLFLFLFNGIGLFFTAPKYPDTGITVGMWIIWIISAFILVAVLQFFRNPKRKINYNDNYILAPADGKVVVIEEVYEPEYFKENRLQVSIFMSPINVHVNRYPISGVVKYAKYHPGLYLVAWHPKSSTENERTSIVVQSNNGQQLLFRQIAGALARRIVFYCKEGDKAKQGEEFGFIKFGSRVDLFLPLNATVNVQLNQTVKGGQTVIAQWA